MTKDKKMRSTLLIIAIGSGLSACATPPAGDVPASGLAATHVPVVSNTTYVFDAAAPGGVLPSSETARMVAWLNSLDLRYGDGVYVEGGSSAARGQVADVVGHYGMLLSQGAPVTPGAVPADAVRVIVSRAQAFVPGCPDFGRPSQPDYANQTMSNFGCGVSAALAAQVANPNDLLHGRAGDAASDGSTGAKAIKMYRDWPLTAIKPGQELRPLKTVQSTSTKEK